MPKVMKMIFQMNLATIWQSKNKCYMVLSV
jgi:hypothetical protein